MIYRVLVGYDTGGIPIYKWHCDCHVCQSTSGQCTKASLPNTDEDKESRDIARREYYPFLEP